MFVHDRHAAILAHLAQRPRWTVTDLQGTLRVSRSTLRRDLMELQDRGELLRVHGGVVHAGVLKGDSSLDKRAGEAVDAKKNIAASAAKRIPSGATVYIDAGTTCLEVGRRLMIRGDVRIITHSIRLLMEADGTRVPVTCVGGEYRSVSQAVVGGLALEWMNRLRCDVAVIGASGLHADGPSTTEISETVVKQAALRISDEAILVAHAAKWDVPAAVRFAEWDQFNSWITDPELPAEVKHSVGKLVDVVIAEAENK